MKAKSINIKENSKEILKRHEIKFTINHKEEINFLMKNKLETIFPSRIVESIYFDTNSLKFFNLSEEGITPRKKIRLRGYNGGKIDNLEIKVTNNYHREKVVIKQFDYNSFNLHASLKKNGVQDIVKKKLKVKYLRNYYFLKNVGRITIDKDIEFLLPFENFYASKKIKNLVLEVKIQGDKIDKNYIEKIINFREIRFSKYCTGINLLYK